MLSSNLQAAYIIGLEPDEQSLVYSVVFVEYKVDDGELESDGVSLAPSGGGDSKCAIHSVVDTV